MKEQNTPSRFNVRAILLAFHIFSVLTATAQEAHKPRYFAGIGFSAENLRSPKLDHKPFFWNYGLSSEAHFGNRFVIQLNLFHSIRDYEVKQGGLLTSYDFDHGLPAAYYSSTVAEKLIEMENFFKYKLKQKRTSPFIGLGYCLQFPYDVQGKRMIVHADGFEEKLSDPGKLSSKINPGIYPVFGFSHAFSNKANLLFSLGYKWYLNSNLAIYGYPSLAEAAKMNHCFVGNLGFMYQVK